MRRSGGRFTTARAYCTGTTRRRPPRRSPCAYGTLGAEDNGLLIRGSLVRTQLGEPFHRARSNRSGELNVVTEGHDDVGVLSVEVDPRDQEPHQVGALLVCGRLVEQAEVAQELLDLREARWGRRRAPRFRGSASRAPSPACGG